MIHIWNFSKADFQSLKVRLCKLLNGIKQLGYERVMATSMSSSHLLKEWISLIVSKTWFYLGSQGN